MTTPWPLVELVALLLHLRLDRCTLACLERRELLLLPPHILHHSPRLQSRW